MIDCHIHIEGRRHGGPTEREERAGKQIESMYSGKGRKANDDMA